MQQSLLGIGVQLQDTLDGFTVMKLIEGGPSERAGTILEGDRIIEVDDEPVVGMSILDFVGLVRGPIGTEVNLGIMRMEEGVEKLHDIVIVRDKMVFNEARLEVTTEPYGQGKIAVVKLHSFYEDESSSAALDISRELQKIKSEGELEGVVLDLRGNTGGLITQGVAVTGLFISQGVVVSIRDSVGRVVHLRDFSSTPEWTGPLVVLASRTSISASEIVSQALQDYGRALVIGDASTYGKGSFQRMSINHSDPAQIDHQGEYKVTGGLYYTVSGRSPQLTGVQADVVVPGPYSEVEVGEQYAKNALENDYIADSFVDRMEDLTIAQQKHVSQFYGGKLQQRLERFSKHLPILKENSKQRVDTDPNYQEFLKLLSASQETKELEEKNEEEPPAPNFGKQDLQLAEALQITKDLILLDMSAA